MSSAIPSGPVPHPSASAAPWEAVLHAICQELGDEAHHKVSARRAANLLAGSGRTALDFMEALLEARATTLAYAPGITRRARAGGADRKNLVPYFFATLEGLLAQDMTPPVPLRSGEAACGLGGLPAAGEALAANRGHTTGAGEHLSLWDRVCTLLCPVLAPEVQARWLAPARQVGQDGDILFVLVSSALQRHWLERNLGYIA